MKKLVAGVVGLTFMLAACSGGGSLTGEQEDWCWGNSAIVSDAADDLGLLDLVDAYYDVNGDGFEDDGSVKLTDRNIELSEELKAKNSSDGDALFDELFAAYLTHPDGQEACAAAHAEEA